MAVNRTLGIGFENCISEPCLFISKTLLLVASYIDSNADCTRLVVDGWIELELRNPEEALRVLSSALTLRADWERLLSAQLGHDAASEDAAQRVSRKTREKLSEGLVRYLLYTEVPRRNDAWQTCTNHTLKTKWDCVNMFAIFSPL